MARVTISDTILTDVADAIRTKTSTSAQISPLNFKSQILGIPSGGGFPENWYTGSFTVAERTNQAVIIDLSDLPISNSSLVKVLIFPEEVVPTSFTNYTIVGITDFILNGLLVFNYQGSFTVAQTTNCPLTVDNANKTMTFGPATGSYKFDPQFTYRWVVWVLNPTS